MAKDEDNAVSQNTNDRHDIGELLTYYYAQLGDYHRKYISPTEDICDACRENHGSFEIETLQASRDDFSVICSVLDKHRDTVLSFHPERFQGESETKYDQSFFSELESLNKVCTDFVAASQVIQNTPSLFDEIQDTCLYAPLLGMSLVDHDAKNLFMAFQQLDQLLTVFPSGSSEAVDFVQRNEYDILYQNACMMLYTIYSIADNEVHSYRIPSESIPSLMAQAGTRLTDINFSYDSDLTVDSCAYYTTLQFIKNAVSYGQKEATEKTINYAIDDDNDSLQLLVEDKGQGIPKSIIKDIFASYTSKGTGIGLQAARALASLSSGSLMVRTSYQDETYLYSIDTDEIEELRYNGPGTCFILKYSKE